MSWATGPRYSILEFESMWRQQRYTLEGKLVLKRVGEGVER